MNETLAHQSTVLYKRLCVNIINKHKIYFRSQYNINISINLNNHNVQDRPTHLDPGTRPLSLATVILCVSTGNACGAHETHPLIGYMPPEVVLRMRELREAIPGNLGFQAHVQRHIYGPARRHLGYVLYRTETEQD